LAIPYFALAVFSEYWLGVLTDHPIGDDFNIYYDAYLKAAGGADPYSPYVVGKSFLYHPFALTLVSCFAWHQDESLARLTWIGANALAWLGSIFIVWRLIRANGMHPPADKTDDHAPVLLLLTLSFLGFAPFWETLHIGQVNALVALCLFSSFYLADARPICAGVCLALAIILKISPAIFVLYFLVLPRTRVVIATLASLALLSAVSAFQFSPLLFTDFLAILPRLSAEVHATAYNQSVLSTVAQILDSAGHYDLVSALVVAHRLLFVVLAGALLASGRLISPAAKELQFWLFSALLTVVVIFSPLVWYHHSALLLLPIAALMFHPSRFYNAIAFGIVLLIQADRLFEHAVARIALPVLLAHILLVRLLVGVFFSEWLQMRRMGTAATPRTGRWWQSEPV
jgi:hypothetical protein